MFILITDETNKDPSNEIKFFIYGGLILPIEKIPEINNSIKSIRDEAGYKINDSLKFDTHSRPDYVKLEIFNKAKEQVIDLCHKYNCRFITYIIHHKFLKNQSNEQIINSGADYVLGRFNKYLENRNTFGFCFLDNFPYNKPNPYSYLKSKFINGLRIHDKDSYRDVKLNQIKLYAFTCNNASYISSAVDIILGGFRYCVNQPKKDDIASKLFLKIIKLMWCKYYGNKIIFKNYGLIVRPNLEKYKDSKYYTDYQELFEYLNNLLK